EGGLGSASTEVCGRGPDELGDLVAVLKLAAIDLEDGPRVAEQSFRHGFDNARLTRTGRSQEQEIAHGAAWGIQPRQEHLVYFDDFLDGLILAYDFPPQTGFKVLSI